MSRAKSTHALRGASSGKGCKCSGDTQRSHICEAISEFQSEVFQKLFWVQISNSFISEQIPCIDNSNGPTVGGGPAYTWPNREDLASH